MKYDELETPPGKDLREKDEDIFEFSISCCDRGKLESGDFISYKRHPAVWGKTVSKDCQIVVIKNITQQEAINLCSPQYLEVDKKSDPPKLEMVKKRQYKLPISVLKKLHPSIDEVMMADPTALYQPLKHREIVLDYKGRYAKVIDKSKAGWLNATKEWLFTYKGIY